MSEKPPVDIAQESIESSEKALRGRAEKIIRNWEDRDGKQLQDSDRDRLVAELLPLLEEAERVREPFENVPVINFVNGKLELGWPRDEKNDYAVSFRKE